MRFSKLEEELTVNLLYSAFIREESESKGAFKKVLAQSLTFNDQFDNVFIYRNHPSWRLEKNEKRFHLYR